MDAREQRIVQTAVELAESGGFKAVRMRDVAARSGCALATLYRHFPTKDDLLLAALNREAEALDRRMRRRPPRGRTPLARITAHFAAATETLFRRPALAREIVRAATADNSELWRRIRGFHGVAGDLAIAALRGDPQAKLSEGSALERRVSQILYQVWFASLVGAVGGQYPPSEIPRRVRAAAQLVLRGAGLET